MFKLEQSCVNCIPQDFVIKLSLCWCDFKLDISPWKGQSLYEMGKKHFYFSFIYYVRIVYV